MHPRQFSLLFYFFRSQKLLTAIVLLAMIVSGILESLNLAALYPIINYGLKLTGDSKFLTQLDSLVKLIGRENLFVSSCILLIVVTILATIARIVYQVLSNYLWMKIISANQRAIFQKYLHADYQYFVKSQQGKLIYTGTVATLGVANNIYFVIRIVNSAIIALFFTVLLIFLTWQGVLFITVLGALYVLFVRGLLKKVIHKFSHLTVDEDRKKNVILNEFITGVKTIKAFFNNQYWQDKYREAVESSVRYDFNVRLGKILPDSFIKFIFFICVGGAGIFLFSRFHGDILPLLPALGTFVGVASRLFPYINLIGSDIVAIARYMPDTKIVYSTLEEKTRVLSQGKISLTEFKDEIKFNKVWFRYDGQEEWLLEDLSLRIPQNKVTAIVGSSGSGKSTIVALLLKLYEVHKGAITIDGINLSEISPESYLIKIGYVSQETFIFNGTIAENIRFGDSKGTRDDIVEAAKLANAHEFISRTEDGYETTVGDAGMKLSGGQRQRLAIARAILRKPQILILDEATSSLDTVSERLVQEAINKISRKTTTLIIAHRLSTVLHADRIIVLDHGRIVEEGTHEELLQKKRYYYQLFTLSERDEGVEVGK